MYEFAKRHSVLAEGLNNLSHSNNWERLVALGQIGLERT